MSFTYPELWLLLIPCAWVAWQTRTENRVTLVLRAFVLVLLLGALTGTHWRARAEGRDVIFLVDRSRSMRSGAADAALEAIRLVESERRRGDRVGVLSFASEVGLERLPSADSSFQRFESQVAVDGSDLALAVDTALSLLEEDRLGSLVVLSDGEDNGGLAADAARRALARGVRIDVVPTGAAGGVDASVEAIELPERVEVGEPFQFGAWLRSSGEVEADYRLERAGLTIAEGHVSLERGRQRLVFRDVVADAGVATYRLRLEGLADRVPENDRGLGALWVEGPRGILVLNHDGEADTLTSLLSRSGFRVTVRRPEEAALDPVSLAAYRAIVLENVEAGRLGTGLQAVADFVRERGGGLWMTGGKASFGVGGYHLSAVDDVLPVSMELREEHRKQGLALVMALDRSGSMNASVGFRTKMDLANEGAASAIDLLSGLDAVAVLAVDTRSETIVPLTTVENRSALTDRAARIRAGGGGINTLTALRAAALELADAPQQNRHIIVFADAADADEQAGCVGLVQELGGQGITVSVIALGTDSDQHAVFLRELAAAGGTEASFTNVPEDLPRLFAADTLKVAKSSFVEQRTAGRLLADLAGIGLVELGAFPSVDGFNLTYPRPGASVGVVSADEYGAPLFAFGQRGLGRSAALTAQVGGTLGRDLVAWPEFGELAVTTARWLVGAEEPLDVFTSVRREGMHAVLRAEIDRDAPISSDLSQLRARLGGMEGDWNDVVLERVTEDRFEARVPLRSAGVHLGAVHLGEDRFASLPPITLPYSPEFEVREDARSGERILRELAALSGGMVAPPMTEVFRGERERVRRRSLVLELSIAALVLLMVEIAGRRLMLWGQVRIPKVVGDIRARARRRGKGAPEVDPVAPERKAVVSPGQGTLDMEDAVRRAREKAGRRLGR